MDTILSKQQAPQATPKPQQKITGIDKQSCVKMLDSLFKQQQKYIPLWKDIRNYELPYDGELGDDVIGAPAMHDEEIYNGITAQARDTFAAGIQSGLTPPSRKWFRFAPTDASLDNNIDVARVLDERCEIMESVLSQSNFYNVIHSAYKELPFGQSPVGVFADEKGVYFVNYTIGTYALGADGQGRINTFARKVKMSAAQIVSLYGDSVVTDSVREAVKANGGHEDYYTVCWLVYPNPKAKPTGGNHDMKFLSVHWLEGSDPNSLLAAKGFEEWAIPVARYNVKGIDAYGIGPAWDALPESRMLQKMEFDGAIALELSIKPPLVGPAELQGRINLFPGAYTPSINPNDNVHSIYSGGLDLNALQAKITQIEDRIKRIYSTDLFLMLNELQRGQMTAQEVMARNQEKMAQLGPVIERLQNEFLSDIIERVYNLLERNQVFPPLPEDLQQTLQGQEIKIEYLSPLAQAQRMSGLTAIEQGVSFVGQLAQLDPNVILRVNFDKAVENYLDKLGVPSTMIRTEDEYQEIVQQQQQAQQEQQEQQQQAQQVAQVAPLAQAAKNLTDAANDGNPALRQMMGLET